MSSLGQDTPVKQAGTVDRERLVAGIGIALIGLWLFLTVALPLSALFIKSLQNADGGFVGLDNFIRYFSTPALANSIGNSLMVAIATTVIVVPLAFTYAYALTRSTMPARGFFHAAALLPIFAPSLLPAISLIYLFGNQGILKSWLFGASIYGPLGIILAQVIYCFPHALLILITALSMADARLYEAADALGTKPSRVFFTVTLPGVRYGMISAAFVVFTLVITDFGVAKVIGGQFNMLATDVYKQVMGQQNFQMGAVVGLILLLPAVLAFIVDHKIQKRQISQLSARAVPLVPKRDAKRDALLLTFCILMMLAIVGVTGVAVWASFITYWPYNMTLTLANYEFSNFDATGWAPFRNSILFAAATAVIGTAVIFTGAYLIEKTKGFTFGRVFAQLLAMLPVAVPGLVLGLSYIFFFNARSNPVNFLYGTLALLVINSIAHFYTVSHIAATTALKQIDSEFESVSASLQVPFWRTFRRVTVPIAMPAILDIAVYMFVNAMTTVSAVIFLYGTDSKLASIAIVHMDEAGATAAAAAMATLVVIAAIGAKVLQLVVSALLANSLQAWRRR
ncbi:MAG: putative 2-aminoethylphosphonate ABC transporter permease subunit [Beijerinckiaceae bacterium]